MKVKFKRKRTCYSRISNEKRQTLFNLVIDNKIKLCQAAKSIDIKYSTAKTLMRLYRKKNKVFIKNYEEERKLKLLLENLKFNENIKKIERFKKNYQTSFNDELKKQIQVNYNKIDKKEADHVNFNFLNCGSYKIKEIEEFIVEFLNFTMSLNKLINFKY
jgi:hypothetical protein